MNTNGLSAALIVAANALRLYVGNTLTNVGVDFFGIALPFTNSMFRNGREQKNAAVKALPLRLSVRAGHPFLQFGKIDVSLTAAHETYMRADTTASSFVGPTDTFILTPSVVASY